MIRDIANVPHLVSAPQIIDLRDREMSLQAFADTCQLSIVTTRIPGGTYVAHLKHGLNDQSVYADKSGVQSGSAKTETGALRILARKIQGRELRFSIHLDGSAKRIVKAPKELTLE